MAKIDILKRLVSTKISSDQSRELMGNIIRKEFDETKDEVRAFELLFLAFKWNLKVFESMIDDYNIHDFKWFA